MENLWLSLNVVLPLFLMIATGYFLRRTKLMDGHTAAQLNNIAFRFFLPTLLFYNIYSAKLDAALNLPLIGYAVGGVIATFLVLLLVVPLFEKQPAKRGVLMQGVFRSNFVLFGLPVVSALFDDTGTTALLIAIVVPVFNVLAVISLELFRGDKPAQGAHKTFPYKKILMGIVTNPLIIGSAAGILTLVLGIRLPTGIESAASSLAQVATPLALIVLGTNFPFPQARGNRKQLLFGLLGKLVVYPLLLLPPAILLGFRGVELASLLALYASPAAVSSYTMAVQMDADGDLAGMLVVFGTAASAFTIFLWVFVFKSLGLI